MLAKLKSRRIQALAVSLLAAGLLAVFFRGADFGAIASSLAEAHLTLIVSAIAVVLTSYVLRAIRWKLLLTPVGRPRLSACFITTVIGFMVNFLAPTGRLGEVVRPYLLARREGFSASSAFATIFLERVIDLITVAFLVGGWLLLGSLPQGANSQTAVQGLKLGGVTASVGAGIGLALMFAFVRYREAALMRAQWVTGWFPSRLAESVMRFLKAFGEGLGVLVDGSNLLRTALLSILLWLNISAGVWLGLTAFDVVLPFGAALLVIGFLVVGVAVPTPGAVGGYHLMFALALTVLFGVDESLAKAAALVNHAIAFLPVTLLGLFFFFREGLSFREVQTLEGSGGVDEVSVL